MDPSLKPLALLVEDDFLQREFVSDLLKDANMDVIQCESAEAGELVLSKTGLELAVLVTDVELGGEKTGLDLAVYARAKFPNLNIVVLSGQDNLVLPADARHLKKPCLAADLRREVARHCA